MSDYISREAAYLKIMAQPPDAHYPSWFASQIIEIPAADVRPVVRGRWKQMHYESGLLDGVNVDKCSACGWEMVVEQTGCGFRFCPNCGADMREEAPNHDD